MAQGAVVVRGLRELNAAFKATGKDLPREMRKELRVVAEPVRQLAEELAVGNITNIGSHWSRMRLGVTARSVYVAPASRRAGGSPRSNLADLLIDESMDPALEQRSDEVEKGFEQMIDRLTDRNGF